MSVSVSPLNIVRPRSDFLFQILTASAWTQVLAQVGGAICLAVQAGLQGPDISDWKNGGSRGFWFMFAWTAVCAGQFVILYKEPQSIEVEHELARERIRASNLDEGI